MKTIVAKRFSVKLGLVAFIAGTASFFMPHFSGWNDIVFPQFAWGGLLLYLAWPVLFFLALGVSLMNTLALLFVNASPRNKLISACFSIVLIALSLSIFQDLAAGDYPGINQRVSFFAVGGQTRILWAGGFETVKSDALALLKQQSADSDSVNSDAWPSSLKRLGAVRVRTDNKTQSVIIYIEEAHVFAADQFGYLITNEKDVNPRILNREDNNRLWKLTDGVYFFETEY